MKELRCRDIGFDCDGTIQADSEEAVLRGAAEHARDVHQVSAFSPEQTRQIRAQIHDVPGEAAHTA